MTHTPEQLDAIIAGLTLTMRVALSWAYLDGRGSWRLDNYCKTVTLKSLESRGIAEGSKLTPLGQAVRARMMEVK